MKLNAGSAACRESEPSTAMLRDLECISTADRGRLRFVVGSWRVDEGDAAGNAK